MEETKFVVGMVVRWAHTLDDKGIVFDVVDEDEIVVKFDRDPDTTYSVDPSEIRVWDPEGDKTRAILVQAKIDEATHSLEAAFAALREANRLETGYAGNECYSLRQNKLLNMTAFEEVVFDNGWSTSSIYC